MLNKHMLFSHTTATHIITRYDVLMLNKHMLFSHITETLEIEAAY